MLVYTSWDPDRHCDDTDVMVMMVMMVMMVVAMVMMTVMDGGGGCE